MGTRIPSVRNAARPDPHLPWGIVWERGGGYPPLYSSIIGKSQHTTPLLPVLPISTAKYPMRAAGDCGPYRCFGGCCTVYILRRGVSRSGKRGESGAPTGSRPSREKGVAPVGIARSSRAAPGRHPPHVTVSNMRMLRGLTCACETP